MAEALKQGDILHDRYKIISVLGRGGMSNVYLVEDEKLGSRWALKEMLDVFPAGEKAEILEQFKKEAQILAGIKHPSLPRVFDYFTEEGRSCLVMEYIEGLTLEEIYDRNPQIESGKIIDWSIKICDVLDTLHKQGIIYRDLKPSNVLVDKDNNVFIIDFGIARLFTGNKLHDTVIMGTPGFASPEHHGQAETDARSDVFSLGATMHTLITRVDPGLIPFVFKEPAKVNPDVPEGLSSVIMKALELDPKDRYQSMSDMKTALEDLKSGGKSTGRKNEKKGKVSGGEKRSYKKALHQSQRGINGKSVKEKRFGKDPVKSYLYPALLSGGAVFSSTLLITGGVLTLPVIAFSVTAVAPAAYLINNLIRYVNKSPEEIKVTIDDEGMMIHKGGRDYHVLWEEIISLLKFTEKSRIGVEITKYKLVTEAGAFEFGEEMGGVKHLNDLIIDYARLGLAGQGEGYRRYERCPESEVL